MSSLKDILSSFHLQDELNSKIWSDNGQKMNPKVRERLLEIANDFIQFLGVDVIVSDVIMTGSLANYNWSKFSDIDLHIVANFSQFSEEQLSLYEELFKLKKTLYNDKHNIKIFGYDVELYVQNETEIHFSSGVYSVLFDEWSNQPQKENIKIDTELIRTKSKQWMDIIDNVIDSLSDEPIESAKKMLKKYKDKLKKYRTCGLEKDGEYSDENLVFKVLRRNGYIEKLYDFENEHIDKQLSLKEQIESDEYSALIGNLDDLVKKNITLINEPKPKGSKPFNADTDTFQRALILLGYELPKFGADGKFGSETQRAVELFQKENGLTVDGKINYDDLKKMSEIILKRKPTTLTTIKSKEITLPLQKEPVIVQSSDKWKTIAANYIAKKEGFTSKASDDEGAQRGGYGSDKVLKNGKLFKVTKTTTFTKQEAMNTLINYSIPSYSQQIISDLGQKNWNKLNNNQKAALVSLGYNVGKYYIGSRDYGKMIKSYIEMGDLQKAGETINTHGPKRGKKSGFLRGLAKRRKEESELFLTPE